MRNPRNPFELLACERIASDDTFVRLFGPRALDVLPHDNLWDRFQVFRSAPGGGKTSLFRLFTPESLLTIHAQRTQDFGKELYGRLRQMDVLSDRGPALLGVLVSFSRNDYATLEHLELDGGRRKRLLLALLNSRIVLGLIRGALILKGARHPDDTSLLSLNRGLPEREGSQIGATTSGESLFRWASDLERQICRATSSFAPASESTLEQHDSLFALEIARPSNIQCAGEKIASRVLIMLDDLQGLSHEQREFLLDILLRTRLPMDTEESVSIWASERLEALGVDELLSSGALRGRDYGNIVNLEECWRGRSSRAFERVVVDVADRRVRLAEDVDLGSFAGQLAPSLDGTQWSQRFEEITSILATHIRQSNRGTGRYDALVEERAAVIGTPRERAIAWRVLEILIQRDKRSRQRTLFALGDEPDDSSVKAAAELFLAKEFKLPYYFGMSSLANLASANIEQFIWLASDLFEESLSAALLRRPTSLKPEEQERILQMTVARRWEDLPYSIPHGREVREFLSTLGTFAASVTYQPNAPYAPGVTGIGVAIADREKLRGAASSKDSELTWLARILGIAVANNLLLVTDTRCKGRDWIVFYLNRMLCIHFGLPLQYGGWREKSLRELVDWLPREFAPKRRRQEYLL